MSREEFIEFHGLPQCVVTLPRWELSSKGIIGVSSDRYHVVYSFKKLVDAVRPEMSSMLSDAPDTNSDLDDDLVAKCVQYVDATFIEYTENSIYDPIIVIESR